MNWINTHWIELVGALAGFIYIFFEIKANSWMWPIGLLTSVFYIIVFYESKFYADMSLQFYYVGISIVGWYLWIKKSKNKSKSELKISRISTFLKWKLIMIFLLFWVVIYIILKYLTDSPVPIGDAFTTALSFVATWMLARKIIEHWWLWIIINLVSAILYWIKGLYPTTGLYLIYGTLSIVGYIEWKRIAIKEANQK
ncbi:MAG: nicotinamide mononucleotide transporter [Bacteroidales bacterium]|nr:nicotinamide mononucleotide transporter [Bacteroidales bacterium]